MKKYLILPLIIISIIFLTGCTSKQEIKEQIEKEEKIMKSDNDKAIDSCINLGGVPIRSTWDNRLKRCDFPPNN